MQKKNTVYYDINSDCGRGSISRRSKIELLRSAAEAKNVILFQAKAGQGKTTFALEAAESLFDSHIYYKVSEGDKDPVNFCISMHSLFTDYLPKYRCPEFEKAIMDGIEPYEADGHIKNIIRSVRKVLLKKTVVILDDVQTLPDIGLACMTVMSALTSAGGLLSFFICTRNNCVFPDSFSKLKKNIFKADDEFLQVTDSEFKELAVKFFSSAEDLTGLDRVHKLTEGWMYGILIFFNYLREHPGQKNFRAIDIPAMFAAFFQGLTEKINQKIMKNLSLLALCDTFDYRFVQLLDPTEKTLAQLNDMLARSTFTGIYSDNLIRYHNIFREWLRQRAAAVCTDKEISDFYRSAYEFEYGTGNRIMALKYLISSKDYNLLEKYISERYFSILSSDFRKSLYAALSVVPPEILARNPWTGLMFCETQTYVTSEKKVKMLNAVLDTFRHKKDDRGILAVSCSLTVFNCEQSADLDEAQKNMDVVTTLAHLTGECRVAQMHVNLALALGSIYLKNPQEAFKHINIAHSIAETDGIHSAMIRIFGLYCDLYIISGNKQLIEKYCDAMIIKLNTSALNYNQKILIFHKIIYYALINGKHNLMRAFLRMMKHKARLHIEADSKTGSFFEMAEVNLCMVEQDYERTGLILEKFSENKLSAMAPHISCFIYSVKAIHAAYVCDEKAAELAEKAIATRESTPCSDYYRSIIYYMAGAAYALMSSHKKATQCLHKAIELSENSQSTYAAAASYAYLSYLYHNIGDKMRAREHAICAVRMFSRTGSVHYFSMLSEVSLNACTYGITSQLTAQTASETAYELHNVCFDTDGRQMPVLNIKTLGRLTLSAGSTRLDFSDIGTNFRQMLAVLLSSPGYAAEQESVQAYLWPDSSRDKARKSFDNLVSRLRKMLSESFPGLDPKNYLSLHNGILRLTNIKCDADVFINSCKKAKDHYGKGEYSAAAENLLECERLFENRFFANITGISAIEQKCREIDSAFINMLKMMQRLGFFLPDIFSPEQFYERWLNTFMSETDMVIMAYKYYRSQNSHQKCRELINTYTRFLKSDGYTDQEIYELVFLVKSAI